MGNIGNAFSLPFKDPGWFGKFVVIGLISFIPIVGGMNSQGWMLATLDNYRRGDSGLPPAGLNYIGRGAQLWLVELLYGLVLVAAIGIPILVGITTLSAGSAAGQIDRGSAFDGATFGAIFPLLLLAILVITVVRVALFAPFVLQVEREGMRGGFNFAAIYQMAAKDWGHTLLAGMLVYVAAVIGGFGIYACCVGLLVSVPYSYAVMAGIMRFYEATFEGQAQPPLTPGPPAPSY